MSKFQLISSSISIVNNKVENNSIKMKCTNPKICKNTIKQFMNKYMSVLKSQVLKIRSCLHKKLHIKRTIKTSKNKKFIMVPFKKYYKRIKYFYVYFYNIEEKRAFVNFALGSYK